MFGADRPAALPDLDSGLLPGGEDSGPSGDLRLFALELLVLILFEPFAPDTVEGADEDVGERVGTGVIVGADVTGEASVGEADVGASVG